MLKGRWLIAGPGYTADARGRGRSSTGGNHFRKIGFDAEWYRRAPLQDGFTLEVTVGYRKDRQAGIAR